MRYLEKMCDRKQNDPAVWACRHRREEVRLGSSSGGVFPALAQTVIQESGIVFGVRWNEKWEAVYGEASSPEEMEAFRGSKYVQSDPGDALVRAKAFLEEGRLVLFSGTPCQIAGLKRFLSGEYENLITVDVICHGVPSPLVWRRYLAELTGGKTVTKVSFRDKTWGWRDFSLRVDFENHRSYRKKRRFDPYLRGFQSNIDLRPSCYACRFKGANRAADLTLGDFWGVEKYLPEWKDDEGASLVIAWSERGARLLEDTLPDLTFRETDLGTVERTNTAYHCSMREPKERILFFDGLSTEKRMRRRLTRLTGGSALRRLAMKLLRRSGRKAEGKQAPEGRGDCVSLGAEDAVEQGFLKRAYGTGTLPYAERQACCGCGACVSVCHTGAISMYTDEEGFWYPQIQEEMCVGCGRCLRVCPMVRMRKRDG